MINQAKDQKSREYYRKVKHLQTLPSL